MAKENDSKSFMLYKDWEKYFAALSSEECSQLLLALFAYVNRGEEPQLSGAAQMAFMFMRDTLDRDSEKWEKVREVRSRAGKKGSKSNDGTDEQAETNDNKDEQNITNDNKTNQTETNDNKKEQTATNSNSNSNSDSNSHSHSAPDGAALTREGRGAASVSKSPPGFDSFWTAYPKKTAKQEAVKAWQKLKPDKELTEKILASLERQKKTAQWTKDGGQFIPYPATWLNGKRWEDETEPAAVPRNTGQRVYTDVDPDNPWN